ncbi:MAG: S9 family peptidase [Candidatus Eisenbacteria bacterium]|uniref:Acyl-peptide hydrolase n=1 Tax=Eiseniibacteriota bacterium TaxID=2212470 RepID=A0A538U8F6_UNCEI|nr:MAG: S9 family peptidase [Candidatus Eisenbacteria bacterium]
MTLVANAVSTLHPARQPLRGSRSMTAEDLWAIPRVGSPVPSPGAASFAVTVTTYDLESNQGRGRVWLVPCERDRAPGDARPLTSVEASSGEPAFAPDGTRLAFTRKSANGKVQLQVIPLDGGEAQKLIDLPLGGFDPRWLPDGNRIVFWATLLRGHFTPEATRTEIERRDKDPVKAQVTEERLYRYWDTWLTTGETPHLFVLDLAAGSLRDLTPDSIGWLDWMDPSGHYDVSPDGREIVFSGILFDHDRSLVRSVLHRVPLDGGAVRSLTASHPAEDLRPRYARDGSWIVFGMTEDPTFYADRVRLMRMDRASGKVTPLLVDWDRSPIAWEFAPDGTLFLTAEDQGRTSIFALDPASAGDPREVVRGGTVSGFAPMADGRLIFTMQSLSQPPEVFLGAPEKGSVTQATRFTDPVLESVALGEVREMRLEGAKGETIQMFVTLPPDARGDRPLPMVQMIHGGPHGISGDAFHFRWSPHVFAAAGYVVAQVNFQGSTSWGQDFAQRIQGGWGDRPFEDVMRATDHLIACGLADPDRMAAAGGSYGGYMAAWIAGHTDRFRCIVNHAGVYDLLGQYASDVTQGRAKSMGGEPWDGLEAIERWSPARFASGFSTPMLVLHGERDYRVPVTQGLACYGVLKAKGIPARLVYFPDENHWILKPRNSLLWYREVLGWLERWIAR